LEGNSLTLTNFAQIDASVGQFGGEVMGVPGGSGNAGNISITANQNLEADLTLIQSGTAGGSTGNAGNITLTSTQGNISLTTFTTVTTQSLNSSGNTGNTTLSAPHGDIFMSGGVSVGPLTFHGGTLGGIQITANNLQLDGGQLGFGSSISGDNF